MKESNRHVAQKVGSILLWLLTIFQALALGVAGFAKFGSADVWIEMFTGWGYPVWFSYLIGAAEMVGAIGLLVPRFATYAASGLFVIMVGALATIVINVDPLGVTAPSINLIALSIIAAARSKTRWRPAATATGSTSD